MTIEYETVFSPRGREMRFAHRNDTADLSAIGSTNTLWGSTGDEYLLRDHSPMTGWAIDVGAHVGAVALALAVDHPRLRVIAIEAIPENCEMIRASIALNGITTVEVIEAAASDVDRDHVPIAYNWTSAAHLDDDYVGKNRFIGGMLSDPSGTTVYPPGVSLSSLIASHGMERVRFLKIDCEGCEWAFLTSPDIGLVDEIIGEYHFGGRMKAIHQLLDETHSVEFLGGDETVGLFKAHVR